MLICIISKADAFGGGASKCAQDLSALLQRNGVSSTHFCAWAGAGFNKNRKSLFGNFQKTGLRVHGVSKTLGLPEILPFELMTLLRNRQFQNYDLFHFHDISSAISPYTLLLLSQYKPVVWTIHDCSPFTAGCLYPMQCEKYQSVCTACPQLGIWPLDNTFIFTRYMQNIKKKIHRNNNITCITPSEWMADTAFKASIILRKPTVINNGVDIGLYHFHDKVRVKKELGVPLKQKTILLSAGNLDDPRKGINYALEGLQAIASYHPHILLMGVPSQTIEEKLTECGFSYTNFGYISDPVELSRRYAAADLFLFCSLADNQPLAILESLASGTPVIGFATGGIPELIELNQTGLLAPPKDLDSLVELLKYALDKAPLENWSIAARSAATKKFSYERYVAEHIKFYQGILSANPSAPQNSQK